MKSATSELLIACQRIDEIKHNPRNSRTHSKRQVRQIANSIKAFGFTNPVLLDRSNTVIAGHGRVAAAKLLGMPEVPTIRLENLSPDQVRAYVIADNRLAEKAGWDKSILAIELQNLLTIESDFDVTITGFEIPEIDLLLTATSDKPDPDDDFEITEMSKAVTQPGDLWQLGRHRIICGNSIEQDSFSTLLGKKRAAVAFSDPPYNVEIDGNVSGNGVVRHREFKMASGEMNEFEFVSFLTSSLRLLARFSVNGSVHFVCMDWRHMSELLSAGREAYESLLNVCVWVKNNGGMGSLYRSRHELVFVFRNGKEQHRNNVQLGRYGRNRTNVWEYPSANTQSKISDEGNLLALHPTPKPVALVADALLDCSARGDVALDAFLGSGSTLIAAERTGRCCHGIELDPIYVDTAIKRWQRYTGDHAVHAVSGIRFDDIATKPREGNHG
jgi:DNA modification methylase